jgi:RimJ/RimL family protein N-acetyltransferase
MADHEYIGGEFGIRRYQEQDIRRLYEAARESITEVYPWMHWCHPDYSLEESSSFVKSQGERWEERREYNLLIFEVGTGAFVGGVGVNQINRPKLFGNLGYWVRTGSVGRGAATSATMLAARFAFEELGLERIEIVVAVGNTASQRVAEKSGATREGVLRRRLNPHDAVMYSLLREDMAAWPR